MHSMHKILENKCFRSNLKQDQIERKCYLNKIADLIQINEYKVLLITMPCQKIIINR